MVSQHPKLGVAIGSPISVGVEGQRRFETVGVDLLHEPHPAGVEPLVIVDGSPRHDAVEVVRIPLRLHQTLTAAGGTSLKVGELRGFAVVGARNRLAGHGGQMHGPVAEVDFGLPVVPSERRPWLDAVVVTGVAVGDGVAFSHAMIGIVQVAVLSPIAPLEESPVPILGQRELHVESDGGGEDAPHVAVGLAGGPAVDQSSGGDRQVAQIGERFARQRSRGRCLRPHAEMRAKRSGERDEGCRCHPPVTATIRPMAHGLAL